MGDVSLELAHFSTKFIYSSASYITSEISAKQMFIAFTIMYNMLHILIGKKSILSSNCNSSSSNSFAVILVIVHKPFFDFRGRGCSNLIAPKPLA